MNKRRAIISRSRKRLYSIEDVKPENHQELDKFRTEIESLERDNAEIREATERNAMQMIAVARKNRDYIDEINQLKMTNNELLLDIVTVNGKMDDVRSELTRQKSNYKSIADVAIKQREQIKSMATRQALLEATVERLRRENVNTNKSLELLALQLKFR